MVDDQVGEFLVLPAGECGDRDERHVGLAHRRQLVAFVSPGAAEGGRAIDELRQLLRWLAVWLAGHCDVPGLADRVARIDVAGTTGDLEQLVALMARPGLEHGHRHSL